MLRNNNSKLNYLILGGGGFLGKNLAELLLAENNSVRIFERIGYDYSLFPRHDEIEWFFGDLYKPADIMPALRDVDVLYLFPSTTHPKSSNDDFCYDIETNLISSISYLQFACDQGIKKVIFPSSGGTVYGIPESIPIDENHPTNPICSYGINKLAIEKYLNLFNRLHGMNYTALRISNPYGRHQLANSGQGAIAAFLHKALHDEEIEIWGDGTVIRDYIYVEDVARAFYSAAHVDSDQRIFNIGSSIGYSVNDILSSIEILIGKTLNKRYLDGRILDVPTNVLDITKAKEFLGWEPRYCLTDGLKETVNWMETR